jgi:hypothetical protein
LIERCIVPIARNIRRKMSSQPAPKRIALLKKIKTNTYLETFHFSRSFRFRTINKKRKSGHSAVEGNLDEVIRFLS